MARFVLVHGAFGGAWCWEPMVGPLEAAGHSVEAIDLPGAGDDLTPPGEVTLDAYAEHICSVLGEREEPAILVGHSAGGMAITQAAARCPQRIVGLAYVAAFLPQEGQSLQALTRLPEGADDQVQANMVVEPPVARLPADAAPEILYQCCPPEVGAREAAKLKAQPLQPFVDPVKLDGAAAASELRRVYVLCERDRAIPPALQRRMAAEGGIAAVIELDTDHSPMVSAIDDLVEALDRFAR
jgi:pimeloyl-ACP methyl ester carboxylesterase